MEAKVGKYKVIHTQSLILPEGQDGWLSFDVKGWNAKFKVQFVKDDSSKGKQVIAIASEADYGIIRLGNWENSLGSATIQPIQIASLGTGENLFFMLTHWFIGNVNRCDIQFLLEEKI